MAVGVERGLGRNSPRRGTPGLRPVLGMFVALGWYDTNGDGALNAGDFAGTSAVVEAVDRGLFRGNVNHAPDVALTLIP